MSTINLAKIDFGGIQTPSGSSAKLQEKSATITVNGSHIITPDTGYDAMIQCVVDVNVSGEIDFSSIGYTPEMTKEINDEINSDIAYSEQLLEEYSDDKRYEYYSKLVYAPLFPTQNRTDFDSMFYECSALTSVPALDTANGTNFEYMFYYCSSLTSIPALDLSKGTNFRGMFVGCPALTSVPALNTSNGTDFQNMFLGCEVLPTIPLIDTANGTNFSNMFAGCWQIKTMPTFDISNGRNMEGMFSGCSGLINITFTGLINSNISFRDCRELSYDSIKSILTACSNTTYTFFSKTVSFDRTIADQNNELTNLVSTCTSKKWTIEGLTITTE